MRLYLVQHGHALSKEVDPKRALSERGRKDVERVAGFLKQAGIHVSRVVHSGKTRARQTAEILALATRAGVEARSGIDPLDPVEPIQKEVENWTEDRMLVGHLPSMGKLASRLVTGREAPTTVAFQPGTVVCLERTVEGDWTLAWVVPPELLAGDYNGDLR